MTSKPENSRWYLAHTLPAREEFAAQQLRRQGFAAFLPKMLRSVRHARRIQTKLSPYFPGYLFVALDLSRDRWRSVNGTFGIAYLIAPGDQPQAVPAGVVETLVACSDPRGVVSLRSFAPGQRVRMNAGPFAERLGVIDRLDDSGRVRVLLEIMGGTVPVETEGGFLIAAD